MTVFRVVVIVHEDLVPPARVAGNADQQPWITEYDVIKTLREIGHDVHVVGVADDWQPIRKAIHRLRPHIVFNLLVEFAGSSLLDQNIVSLLEMLGAAYTGSCPRSLIVGRDKALCKKVLQFHGFRTPRFWVVRKNAKARAPDAPLYPLIVKCLQEEASLGLARASVVHCQEKLLERIAFLRRRFQTDVLVEEFVAGRELFVGILGNHRLQALPVWELFFDKARNADFEIYSRGAKFSEGYRNRLGIRSGKARLSDAMEARIQNLCKDAYRSLGLSGYARFDLRLDANADIHFLEVNPNPDIAFADEFAESARYAGITYGDLLHKILTLGVQRDKVLRSA